MVIYETLRRQKLKGTLQTVGIAILMVGVAFFIGKQLLGSFGLFFGLAVATFVAFAASRSGVPSIVSDAFTLNRFNAPELYGMVGRLAKRAGLSRVPTIHLLQAGGPNAMTFSRKEETHLVLTRALWESLSPQELAAVLAHEIAHIRNRDLPLFRFAETVRQATLFMSRFGWVLLLFSIPFMFASNAIVPFPLTLVLIAAPIVSLLLQLALFRTREFEADLTAAELTGNARALASALYRIEQPRQGLFGLIFPIAIPAQSALFRTHPETKERIRRLLAVSG